MAAHNDLGKKGEDLALQYLKDSGYEILATNWSFDKAEIDIICVKSDILAVIEVKTRSSTDFGLPQEFVKPAKIRLLLKAVNEFVREREIDSEIRFDIIAISKNQQVYNIEHLENAFYHFSK